MARLLKGKAAADALNEKLLDRAVAMCEEIKAKEAK